MPGFTLLFTGLILHRANRDGSRTAILVHDHHHEPKLLISRGVGVEVKGDWKKDMDDRFHMFDLHKRVIAIDAAEKSSVSIGDSFTDHVPRLQEILETPFDPMDDDLKPEVKGNETKDEIAAAYVDYSGGTLSVTNCFPRGATYLPPTDDDPRCIGRIITFVGRTTTSGSVITIQDKAGGSLTVPDGTEIWIVNTARGEGNHHFEYRRLLKSKKKPRIMRKTGSCVNCVFKQEASIESENDRAEQASPRFIRSLSIECSNSQWP